MLQQYLALSGYDYPHCKLPLYFLNFVMELQRNANIMPDKISYIWI